MKKETLKLISRNISIIKHYHDNKVDNSKEMDKFLETLSRIHHKEIENLNRPIMNMEIDLSKISRQRKAQDQIISLVNFYLTHKEKLMPILLKFLQKNNKDEGTLSNSCLQGQ